MNGIIKLTVGGIAYTVKGEGNQEYLNELGGDLERTIARIAKQNPSLSTTMIAILAALEFCDDAKKAKLEADSLRKELSYALKDPFQLPIEES